MNYLFYRRIRGPIFLLTFGVTAALAVWHVIGFNKSWPLYLIVYGVLRLAEGAALAADGTAANPLYPTQGYPAQSYPAQGYTPSSGSAFQGSSSTGVTVPGTGLATVPPPTLQRIQTTEEES